MAAERLQKIIAAAGIASRRKAEELITSGQVAVNGKPVTELGTKADPAVDRITVAGKVLQQQSKNTYILLNKPKGYVSTVNDPEGRNTVLDLIGRVSGRVYPVGRLDYNSEGLLILTNDGELANKLTHASSGVQKTYLVKVSGNPTDEAIERLRAGVNIPEGRDPHGKRVKTAPAKIRKFREGDNPWYEVMLIEGRNRQIRKMFEEVGHHVEKIKRVKYGPLELDVELGRSRALSEREVQQLRRTAEGHAPQERPRREKRTHRKFKSKKRP
jgi:23S rRNA pseudouridine2605 synthase